MLSKKQISEVREHLEKAQNPLFLFDNDQDGLCSFLLLYRAFQKGKGFPIKGSPELTEDYLRKVREFESDYIFILDKPRVSEKFFEKVREINIPVVWIDHHFNEDEIPNFVYYYNSAIENKNKVSENPSEQEGEPVTAICYELTKNKKDLWIAVAGAISDHFIPDYYEKFLKDYPELGIRDTDKAFDILYKSDIGKIARIFGNGLKDRTTNVIKMMKFLMKAKNPYDVLNENKENSFFHKRSLEIDKKQKKLITKAVKIGKSSDKPVLVFEYRGDLSISSELANELRYLFPDKTIVVIYIKDFEKANISVRGKNVRNPILKLLEEFENASGGGHENAVGLQVKIDCLSEFKKRLINALS
ncbi:hypothetical protein K9L16_00975 [Candidatus Pacearchaeota archaeon]|nr:hypothetical protein [Candidatus Pacearchaeota archaeon]